MEISWTASDALNLLDAVVRQAPMPRAGTDVARRCGESIGRHLIFLVLTASDANTAGRHSAALALFRALEDALDCFAAVSLVPGAAERWAQGQLKASEAARLWEPHLGELLLPTGERTREYRKQLRSYFNNFAHCSPYLTDWNMFPEVEARCKQAILANPAVSRRLEFSIVTNHQGRLLSYNATRIGAYLAAHTLEFANVVTEAYAKFLEETPGLRHDLGQAIERVEAFIRDSFGGVFLGDRPPELEQVVLKDPSLPDGDIAIALNSTADDGAT